MATTSSWSIFNAPVPVVSQHVPPRGGDDNLLCGEACAAAIMGYCWGTDKMPTAYEVNAAIGGMGLTSADQIKKYLWDKFGISLSSLIVTNKGDLTHQSWMYLVGGRLLLLVQQYSDIVTENHWRLVVGMTEQYVYLMEPWNGTVIRQDYDTFWRLFDLAGPDRVVLGINHGPYKP